MRKRITYWVVAAVVTSALVVAGVQLASRTSGHAPARLPALSAAAEAPAALGSGQAAQSTPGVPAPSRVFPGYTIQVRGTLPSLPGSAHAWLLTPPSSGAQADQVAALAAKLGLHGRLVASSAGFAVTDGTRQLVVGRGAGMPWIFGTRATAVCGGPGPARGGGTFNGPMCPAASEGVAPQQRLVPPTRPVALPSLQSAEQTAFGLLKQLGVEADTAGVQALRLPDRWQVSVPALVGGLPTSGLMSSVGVGAQNRVVSASGFLVTPRQGDSYPLLTVQQALDRLRSQPQRPKGPIIMPAEPLPCPKPRTEGSNVACAQGQGRLLPRLVRTVTGVRLGLVFASQALKPGDTAATGPVPTGYLVPAFLFRLEGGGWTDEVPVVAVQDRFLTQPPPATMAPLQSGTSGNTGGGTPNGG